MTVDLALYGRRAADDVDDPDFVRDRWLRFVRASLALARRKDNDESST